MNDKYTTSVLCAKEGRHILLIKEPISAVLRTYPEFLFCLKKGTEKADRRLPVLEEFIVKKHNARKTQLALY
ncbi:hypothetical protein KY385_01475 [Candidatus Parcubacteria bacterium]|nr:hypothetical protein [Candidatus Parcubacteria bacterium]